MSLVTCEVTVMIEILTEIDDCDLEPNVLEIQISVILFNEEESVDHVDHLRVLKPANSHDVAMVFNTHELME